MTPIVARHSTAVADALQDIARKLAANGVEKDETLLALDQRIQGELAKLFPGVSAKTHIPVPEFADFMKSATIRIFEDGYDDKNGRDASSFGHGAQRSVQIALVKCLAEVKREGGGQAGRTTLLLIDEPELYLHPQAVEVVRAALCRLAGNGYQVVVTTHSANMISRSDAPNTLLIRRSVETGTRCYPRICDAVRDAIQGAEHQSELLFSLSNSSKILFSERIGIVEGKTERLILPAIFHHLFSISPDEDKLGLVDIGGTPNIPNTIRVLRAMGIPCKVVADLDFAFKVAPKGGLLEQAHVDLNQCKLVFSSLKDAGLVYLDAEGLPASHNGTAASVAYEILASHPDATNSIARLHDELKESGIWIWSKGAIEAHLGIAKQNHARMHFISKLSDIDYMAAVPDFQSVTAALHWLRE